ncbi:MAG: DUF1819 family protein [Bacteroides sp.]|nr:DUF1819 family protein [Bacteroides sp.]
MTQRELQKKSPYTAGMTGCGFMIDEMNRILPLLMEDNSDALLKQEIESNELLLITTKTTRCRAVPEFKRRYTSMPRSFWEKYLMLSPKMQNIAMFLVLLKAYRIYFDFQIEVVLRKWNSFDQTVTKNNLLAALSDIACNDAFVDSWSDDTRGKIASAFLSVLRKVGFIPEKANDLHSLDNYTDEELKFFVQIGEPWFLEAILLPQYRIETIKSIAL